VKSERIGFLFISMNLPDGVDPDVLFNACNAGERDGAVRNVTGGRVTSESSLTLDGFPVKQFQITGTDGTLVTQRLYLVKTPPRRLYMLSVYGPRAKPDEPDVIKYFNSFKIDTGVK
jgi:hypothetical protein